MTEQIERIIELEYQMFDSVHNENGRASCQGDFVTFKIMRKSQFSAWDDETLNLYEMDLLTAQSEGINLMAEKYAYMMEETDPEGYQRIVDLLRPVDPEKLVLIEPILEIHRLWYEQLAETYPRLVGNGRPISPEDIENSGETSVLTYLRGELLTYSLPTLKSYSLMIHQYQESGINMVRDVLGKTAMLYGFASIEDAERSLQ